MTLDLPNILGLIGSAMMVAAYAYSNLTKAMDLLIFNALNLVGSLLLLASLWVHFNLASMSLEIVWAVIATFGTVKALVERRA